jgi:DNA-binding transcriptional LysR family regulator
MSFTLRQLRYFAAAAEHGTVVGAARALNISQPSVSAAVAKLEQLFEVQLFHRRHAQGVVLTAAGVQVLARARSLLAHAREMEQDVAGLATKVRGEVSVGCFASFAPLFMPSLVVGFAEAYPGAGIRLHEGDDEALLAGLHDGQFDAIVMYETTARPDLEVDLLGEFPPYALLPAGHPLAKKRRVTLLELSRDSVVLLDVAPSREYFVSLFTHVGVQPEIRYHSPSFETVRGLVGKGLGVSVLVTRPHGDRSYDGEDLACRPLSDAVPPGRISLVRLPQPHPTRLLQAFADYCKDYFARQASR